MHRFLQWFSGADKQYETLFHCMSGDLPWIWALAVLSSIVILGYVVVACHWFKNLAGLKKGLARSSLFNLTFIFLFCGICGYTFNILDLWYPARRLQVIFLMILSFFTWRYALNVPRLKIVYEEIHRRGELAAELAKVKIIHEESFRLLKGDVKTALDSVINQLSDEIRSTEDIKNKESLVRVLMKAEEAASGLYKIAQVKNKII
jgi:hypothetical protein